MHIPVSMTEGFDPHMQPAGVLCVLRHVGCITEQYGCVFVGLSGVSELDGIFYCMLYMAGGSVVYG